MANTSILKTFAQETRIKLISLVSTKLRYVLNEDTAELRGYESEISRLREQIANKGEEGVIEEVAYTWFNRVMALRFMDANGYNTPMVITKAPGQTRPEILQDAMGGSIDEELKLKPEDLNLPEAKLYRKLLVAVCNRKHADMPFLFERINDYTELLLPDDLLSEQSFISDIRTGMTDQECENVEIVGWLYQFYITDRKADAEKKKSKKGGLKSEEQAAATQLFTPHWIVRYMVENSLGKIWMTLHPESKLIEEMPYYIKSAEGQNDVIPEDIRSVKDIRFLDPCMGSGHILVYAFDLFVKMYEEEGYSSKDIPALIFENNLYGIDIDERCYQLASFALTMKARAYHRRFFRNPVAPNVIALKPVSRDTIESCGNWPAKSLMWQFENIDTIGSLLKITPEECAAIKIQEGIFGEPQKELKRQAEYLSSSYHCVVTNPPYLGKGMGIHLKKYIESEYPNTSGDVMATFMERNIDFCVPSGKLAIINQDSWMFTVSYKNFREAFLSSDNHIETLIHLGPHAFAEIGGEKVKSVTTVIGKYKSSSEGCYINVYDCKYHYLKESEVLETIQHNSQRMYHVNQDAYTHIEGQPISFWGTEKIYEIYVRNRPLSAVANPCVGFQTADNGRFLRSWYEVSQSDTFIKCESAEGAKKSKKKWFPYNKGGSRRRWYGNQELLINWYNDGEELRNFEGAVIRNPSFYFKPCISWGLISGPLYRYYPHGFIYDVQGMSCFYESSNQLFKEIAWQNTNVFNAVSRIISPAGHIQIGEIGNMPCCDNVPDGIENIAKQNISISKSDWDAHETSWDFERNELLALNSEEEYIAVMHEWADFNGVMADLAAPQLGSLRWLLDVYHTKWETKFYRLHRNEEELNRQFIEIYGLQDELTPDVPLDEVTILQQGEISIEGGKLIWHDDVILKQFISYLVGCLMGRYSVDESGLMIASQNQTMGFPYQTVEMDLDGIIPIITEPDFFADDMAQRIETAIKNVFGSEHFYDNMKLIKEILGCDIREYLYKDFYNDHQQMYSVKGAKRPIYWLFSSKMHDKKKKGHFKALVYMHRMGPDTLSKMHADYVLPYISKTEIQLAEANEQVDRADLSQAQRNKAIKLAEEMRDKLREVKAFEQCLVEMASHRIEIDLDNGVKANYPLFYPLTEAIKGLENTDE